MTKNAEPYRRRWSVVDIAYVRERYPRRSARQIAEDLGQPVERVRAFIYRLKQADRASQGAPASVSMLAIAAQNVPFAGRRVDRASGATVTRPRAANASCAPKSAPRDLLGFAGGQSVRAAARALSVSAGTISRLRAGYWPRDASFLLARWSDYKARHGRTPHGWFVRVVYEGGVVRHASSLWTAPQLRARIGQSVACTRAFDGTLLAQTLDLPAERIALTRVTNA